MIASQRRIENLRKHWQKSSRTRFCLFVFLLTLSSAYSSHVSAQGPDLLQELMRSLQGNGADSAEPEPLSSDRINGLGRVYAPLAPPPNTQPFDIRGDGQTFTVRAPASTVGEVIAALSRTAQIDIVLAGDGSIPISLSMNQRSLDEILSAICMLSGYSWRWHGGTILVAPLDDTVPIDPRARGTVIRSIELHYTTADAVQVAIQDLLTPVGHVHILTSDIADHRKAREVIIIEDIESNVERMTRFIQELDVAPRQVMIEAYVLQVDLKDEDRHGVNFDKVVSWAGVPLTFEVNGFANPNATQAFLARVDGQSLDAVLEALRTQTDSRTLASPRLLVVNGQEKRLQVGEQLGYRTVTTSQSGVTQENIQFLDVGVILSVTPRISPDEKILLKINSEVSTGLVNPQTGLPEESTSEVDTDVLLEDGHGIVIGGLIQEEDTINVTGIKWLSDLKWIGPLFQRKEKTTKRSEIIFVVMPRILHEPCDSFPGYDCQLQETTQSLFPEVSLPSARPETGYRHDPYMHEEMINEPYGYMESPEEIIHDYQSTPAPHEMQQPPNEPHSPAPLIEPGPIPFPSSSNWSPNQQVPLQTNQRTNGSPYFAQTAMAMDAESSRRGWNPNVPAAQFQETGLWQDSSQSIHEPLNQRPMYSNVRALASDPQPTTEAPEIARLPGMLR